MASKARLNYPNGGLIAASEAFRGGASFYCQFDGCNAEMILVSSGDTRAHFRSKHQTDHRFSYCLRQDIVFDSDRYDPNLFHIQNLINNLMNGVENANIHGHNHHGGGVVGYGHRIPVNTLKAFYGAYLSVGINGTYGDCCMNDYICGYDNYHLFENGIEGFKVVELTYYYAVPEDHAIVFNFPAYDMNRETPLYVKVFFDDERDRFDMVKHCKKLSCPWFKTLVIADDWTPVANEKWMATCTVHHRTQHVYIVD